MVIVLTQWLYPDQYQHTIRSDTDSSGCTVWNCPLGSQASGDKDSQNSASAKPWTSLGAKAGVKSGVWFRFVFSWFVIGGPSLESHVFVCVLCFAKLGAHAHAAWCLVVCFGWKM